MDPDPSRESVDSLLAHQEWLRRLARALVRDEHTADDLVQETMIAAWRSPPSEGGYTRTWLSTVLHNSWTSFGRAVRRRTDHESRASREGVLPATADAVALVSIQRDLAEHVLALTEPTREIVLLRFFADMPPRKIAAQLDLPLTFVKNRLQRGLEELRERLDARRGGREEWLACLVPLCGRAVVSAAAKLGSAGLALVLGLLVWWNVSHRVHDDALVARVPVESSAEDPEGGPARLVEPDTSGERARSVRAPVQASPASLTPARIVEETASEGRLRFIDANGDKVAGFRFELRDTYRAKWSDDSETVVIGANFWLPIPPEERARLREDPRALEGFVTHNFGEPAVGRALILGEALPEARVCEADAQGECTTAFERARHRIVPVESWWQVVGFMKTHADRARNEFTCVVAPACELRGRLVDARGLPLVGKSMRIEIDGAFREALPVGTLDTALPEVAPSMTDLEGRFGWLAVPRLPLAGFSMPSAEGDVFISRHVDFGELDAGTEILVTVGSAPTPQLARYKGRVRRRDGSAAVTARVVCALRFVDVDREGGFDIQLFPGEKVRVFERSYGYATYEEGDLQRLSRSEHGVELVLEHELLSLAGVVVDGSGRPIEGASVELAPTHRVLGMRQSLEAWLAGTRGADALTDAQGRFHLNGLMDGDYTITARVGSRASAPITARGGSGPLLVELPNSARIEKLHGRVRTQRGDPITSFAGMTLCDDGDHATMAGVFRTTLTDPGEFEVTDIDCSAPVLRIVADGYIPWELRVERGTEATPVDVRLIPACRLLVSIPATAVACELQVRDATGATLEIVPSGTNSIRRGTAVLLVPGSESSVLVGSTATEFLLVRDGTVVLRRPAALDPDRLNRIELRDWR